jgi:hypothetical protein
VFLLVEETRELSLESLDYVFKFRKTQFMRYQLVDYIPWVIRRYIVRQRPEPEKPARKLLHFACPWQCGAGILSCRFQSPLPSVMTYNATIPTLKSLLIRLVVYGANTAGHVDLEIVNNFNLARAASIRSSDSGHTLASEDPAR